ncbi:MAG TPA: hypothetical protein VJR89_34410 [Polyangiales bacterium]|nr:hypothetical protein [Polyangiales bacterium]
MDRPRALRFARYLALVCAFALLALLGARPLEHDDLFFHLRTGALIAQTGSIPHSDPFSFTLPGAPWTTHEWGFALLAYGVYRAAGYAGLVWFTALLAVSVFGLVYLLMRRLATAERASLLVPLLLLGVLAAHRSGFIMRAAFVATLCFAVLQYLLHVNYAKPSRASSLGIVALCWFWANLHVSVVFGLCIVWLYWLQVSWDAWRAGRPLSRAGLHSRALLALACTAITFANANGWKLWTFPFELNALYYHSGLSWTLNMFKPPRPGNAPFFFLLCVVTLGACLPLARLRATLLASRHPLLFQSFAALFFLGMALRSMRFIPEFCVFALPLCAALLPAPRERWQLGTHAASLIAAVLIAAVLRPLPPSEPIAATFPKRAVEFMRREQLRGRMFNYENWGGYLGWQLKLPVYWDGRNDVFGPLAHEFADLDDDPAELVRRHAIDMLVLNESYQQRFASYLRAHRAEWAVVYFDDRLALYVRKASQPQVFLERYAYELLQPFGVPSSEALARAAQHPLARQKLEREIAQLQRQNPESELGAYLRDAFARARGALHAQNM